MLRNPNSFYAENIHSHRSLFHFASILRAQHCSRPYLCLFSKSNSTREEEKSAKRINCVENRSANGQFMRLINGKYHINWSYGHPRCYYFQNVRRSKHCASNWNHISNCRGKCKPHFHCIFIAFE